MLIVAALIIGAVGALVYVHATIQRAQRELMVACAVFNRLAAMCPDDRNAWFDRFNREYQDGLRWDRGLKALIEPIEFPARNSAG